jgi:hypothetical protein
LTKQSDLLVDEINQRIFAPNNRKENEVIKNMTGRIVAGVDTKSSFSSLRLQPYLL